MIHMTFQCYKVVSAIEIRLERGLYSAIHVNKRKFVERFLIALNSFEIILVMNKSNITVKVRLYFMKILK